MMPSPALSNEDLEYQLTESFACADNESELLNIALYGTAAQVEKLVPKYRQVRMADRLPERQHAGRFLNYRHDEDGSLVLTMRLPAEDGAILSKALEAALEDVPDSTEDVSAETRVDPYTEEGLNRASERRADAVAIVAESFLSNGAASLSGGDRYQVMVHIEADGSAAVDDGPILAPETARPLACDSSVARVTEDADGDPLDVGRKTRSIPPAMRRALRCRDGGCRFPGCTQRRFVDGHHIQHWADGGDTNLGNEAFGRWCAEICAAGRHAHRQLRWRVARAGPSHAAARHCSA